MKLTRKIITMLVVLTMIVAMIPAASAAGTGGGTYAPGATVEVKFQFAQVTGVQGTIKFSNPGIFQQDVYKVTPAMAGGSPTFNPASMTWVSYAPNTVDMSICFSLKISPNAKNGDTCTISFTYELSDANFNLSEQRTESVTITVKGNSGNSDNTGGNTKPPAVKINYTELKNQINVAQGLDEAKYTDASWNVLAAALKNAKAHLSSTSQSAVDAAAKTLKDAIAALVEMDYSKLLDALNKVEALAKDNDLANLFKQLCDAVAEGKALLSSGDQAAVDASTAKILDLLAQITAKLAELEKSEIVYVDKEVKVEVLPSDDYCNIPMHKVWPILFWISLALNVCFIALIICYVLKKKNNRKDNTPLVDYDISDDEE